jgi:hypothetical protein
MLRVSQGPRGDAAECAQPTLDALSVYTTKTLLAILLGAVLSGYSRCAQCTRLEHYW